MVVGLFARLTDLTDLPLDFHPTRQLFSALKARGMYYAWFAPDAPDAIRTFAIQQWRNLPAIEPTVLEVLAALSYRFAGPHLWIARVYSSIFWVLAAPAVYALGRRFASPLGGLCAAAVYLFLPYATIASRSFQPDPLEVALIVASIWAQVHWAAAPRMHRAVAAGLLGGAAVFIKSTAIFFVAGAFSGLMLGTLGWRRWVRDRQAWWVVILTVLPAAAYAFHGIFVAGTLRSQFGGRFMPSLWLDPWFYQGWEGNLNLVLGRPLLALGLLGTILTRQPRGRSALIGWWGGYLLYSLLFDYHAATHDYYQLPLVPLVAVALGPCAQHLSHSLRAVWKDRAPRAQSALLALVVLGVALSVGESRRTLRRTDYRPEATRWQELGESMHVSVQPSTAVRTDSGKPEVVAMTQDYGYSAAYWGWFAVEHWPTMLDRLHGNLAGQPPRSLSTYISELTIGKRYFLVTDLAEFAQQPDLRAYLASHSSLSKQTESYFVYALR